MSYLDCLDCPKCQRYGGTTLNCICPCHEQPCSKKEKCELDNNHAGECVVLEDEKMKSKRVFDACVCGVRRWLYKWQDTHLCRRCWRTALAQWEQDALKPKRRKGRNTNRPAPVLHLRD
jgi:hypothetical protein